MMRLVRELERRLERLAESPGRALGGSVTPAELGARLQREADLGLEEGLHGPVAPNRYQLSLHPGDLSPLPLQELAHDLAGLLDALAAERGWRLEGPVSVDFRADPSLRAGAVQCTAATEPGTPFAWARLTSPTRVLAVHHNLSVVGRDAGCDLVIPDRAVSRRHALLWQESGSAWVRDLNSTNGTYVDGGSVDGPNALGTSHAINFGPLSFVFELL